MAGFKNFLQKSSSGAAAISKDELMDELEKRDKVTNIFPLDVFHENIKPFITALHDKYDLPRSYIGLGMLAAYSTAIGSSFVVSPNGSSQIFMAIWGCEVGLSSAGKSLAIDMTHEPLYEIQSEFDREWAENSAHLSDDKRRHSKLKTVIFRDAHISTLTRSVLPDNPKGVSKYSDEIIEWINGMNSMTKKEGTDEQFWVSSWNCKNYSGIRSGKDKFVIPRPFVNVIGGIQKPIIWKLFAKDRDVTGFIFRLLFAQYEGARGKIASPDNNYSMPKEFKDVHDQCLRKLFFDLSIEDPYEPARKCLLTREAVKMHDEWCKKRASFVDKIEDEMEQEIHSGIYGKMKEYAFRFAGILRLSDRALTMDDTNAFSGFNSEEQIGVREMERALRLADYFYQSAIDTHEMAVARMTATSDVLVAATMMRKGDSFTDIAKVLYGDERFKQKAWRQVKKWIQIYPRVFGAYAK